jgi:hypothetical protein
MSNLNQDSRSSARDLNQRPPEYETEVLTTTTGDFRNEKRDF